MTGTAPSSFGTVDPYEHGVLPVLVMIRNGSKGAVKLDNMKVEYHDQNGGVSMPHQPRMFLTRRSQARLRVLEIPGVTSRKEESARRAGDRDSRLLRQDAPARRVSWMGSSIPAQATGSGSSLYVTSMQEASTGKDLLLLSSAELTKLLCRRRLGLWCSRLWCRGSGFGLGSRWLCRAGSR